MPATRHNYDVIGDVHGHAEQPNALLSILGYRESNGAYRHPERQAIFVGDLIDRGPGQVETLTLVRAMMEAGSARAVMGNHEFNAIAWWLGHRRKSDKNRKQHEAFLKGVTEGSREHEEWVNWFLELPLWIEEDGFRVVHACWSPQHVAFLGDLRDGAKLTKGLIEECSAKDTDHYRAIEALLKGIEIGLPDGHCFKDEGGHCRREIRVQWWKPGFTTYRDAYIGPPGAATAIPDLPLANASAMPPPHRPTFIGHYWLPPDTPLAPRSDLVACVDYSVALGGPLVAYRFDGETRLTPDKFVATPHCR